MTADASKPDETTESEAAEATDVKKKFQEALARKSGKHADSGAAGGGADGSKIHGAHGPAATQRTFRRKSG
jgi:hypothetical protein